jgi:hypothetical protein
MTIARIALPLWHPEAAAAAAAQTPEQIAAAAAAAAATKTPEQVAEEKAATDKAAADAKVAADAETARKAAEAAASTKAPEKYVLTVPDGGRLDADDLARIEAIAKTNGWTQEQAQALVDERHTEIEATNERLRTATLADKEYGGDKWPETERLANLALDKLRPKNTPHGDAFRQLLVKSGYGNHLEVVSFLADLGKLTAEDSPALGRGASGAGARRSTADVLFGETAAKA